MRKKVFSILTALSLALSMLPLSAMAEIPQPTTTTIDGKTYQLGEDVSTSTINLSTTTTSEFTYYTAGEGYILWEPTVEDEKVTSGTMTLHNASIEYNVAAPLITLPEVNINIILEGDNSLINDFSGYEDTTGIQQGEFDATSNSSSPKNYNITVSGTGTLSIDTYDDEECGIFTDGTLIMNSGKIAPSDGDLSLITTDFVMNGGSLISRMLSIKGNSNVKGGSILCTSGIISIGDFTMSGGTLKTSTGSNCSLAVMGQFTKTGGTFNGLVHKYTIGGLNRTLSSTTYGDAVLYEYDANGTVDDVSFITIGEIYDEDRDATVTLRLNIPEGTSLTVPAGAFIKVEYPSGHNLSEYATINGKIINNGTIFLAPDTTAEDVKIIADTIKATGSGTIQVYDEVGSGANNIVYNNSGVIINILDKLDLSSQTEETSGGGYTWTGNDTDGYTLTLESVYINGDLIFPDDVPVTIVTNTDSTILGGITFSGDYGYNVTFKGSATLNIGSLSANGSPENSVIVDGAKLNVEGMINIYGSGNDGNKELFKVINGAIVECGDSVICSTIIVSNNSQLTSHGDSYAVMANANGGNGGNVTITDNSTLTTNCDYGVYIINGKLTVDDTSKLITNAAVAPFCIVDKSNSKTLSDIISLPGLPNGTEYAFVRSNTTFSDYTFWSIVTIGDTLSVTNANSEPSDLNGAVKGLLVFEKPVVVPDNNNSNNNSDTNNSSADVITTTEAPKTEITQPEVTPETTEEKPANNPKTGRNNVVSFSMILGFILISGIIAANKKNSFKQKNK